MVCYPFSGMIDGLLPFEVFELMVCYPFSGLNMGFTPSVGLNMDFTSSVVWIWVLPHRWFVWWTLPIRGLFEGIYPDSVGLISSNVIPKEDCRVFILRCKSASHLTCPVLSVSHVIYSHTSHTGFMHIFIHSFIHIYMHINIHTHIACIQVSFIHNCIDYLVSYFNCISQKCHPHMCLIQMCHQSSVFQMACSPSNSLKVPFSHCFISISNGMFFIEQFENTILPCFLSISNGMFFIEQFESTSLPFSQHFKWHVLHRTVWKYVLVSFSSIL